MCTSLVEIVGWGMLPLLAADKLITVKQIVLEFNSKAFHSQRQPVNVKTT